VSKGGAKDGANDRARDGKLPAAAKDGSVAAVATGRALAGREAEARAERFLLARGMTLVARNYRCRLGEIDLVLRERDSLVMVEVRYRRSAAFGGALASVDARKRARVVAAAGHFLAAHPALAKLGCRFDVVAVSGQDAAGKGGTDEAGLEWIRAAFMADDGW
jgi:putative endonuclease